MKTGAVWLGSILLVLLTLGGVAGLAYFKYRQIAAAMAMPPPPEQVISAKVATATEITLRRDTTMIGTALAPRSIMLSNEVAGTVTQISFEPGHIVDKGQTLVELDTSVERAQLDSAKARVAIARSTLARVRGLVDTRAVTSAELDEAEAQFAQAEAEVNELLAVIERKTLRAPFRGRIGLADTHEGQYLPSGSQIASLQSLDDFIYVDFMIPQSASDSVQVGQPVELVAHGHTMRAEIFALDSRADRLSRSLMGRAELASDPDYLVPGESVKVRLEYGPPMTLPMVPAKALQSAPMSTFVYVVDHDAEGGPRARERSVVPGPSQGEQLTILAGLAAGEQVAADGAFKLRDGARISPVLDDGSPDESASSLSRLED